MAAPAEDSHIYDSSDLSSGGGSDSSDLEDEFLTSGIDDSSDSEYSGDSADSGNNQYRGDYVNDY